MSVLKIIKYGLGALVTIFLGALGSGLWEEIISPLISYLYRLTNMLISSIYSGYYDSVYKSAASAFSDAYMIKISSLILILSGIFILSRSIKFIDFQGLFSKLGTEGNQALGYVIKSQTISLAIALVIAGFIILARANSIQVIQSYSHMSMEILRPYVGEQQYRLLKSDYYRISNAREFKEFNMKIVKFSGDFEIKLPEKYNKAFNSN